MALSKINPTETRSWQLLKDHYEQIKSKHLRQWFKEDAQRFEKFSIQFNDIIFDY